MLKVKLLESVPEVSAMAGSVVELDDPLAKRLCDHGYAELVHKLSAPVAAKKTAAKK